MGSFSGYGNNDKEMQFLSEIIKVINDLSSFFIARSLWSPLDKIVHVETNARCIQHVFL